jgi:hypothetical protein
MSRSDIRKRRGQELIAIVLIYAFGLIVLAGIWHVLGL